MAKRHWSGDEAYKRKICHKNSENISEFWRRDTGLVMKRTRGRSVTENSDSIGEFWRRDTGLVLKRTKGGPATENSENMCEETLSWCCRVQVEDLSQIPRLLVCF